MTAVGLAFSAPKIKIVNPWVMEPPPGPNRTMMGMVVVNEGDEPDYLIGVETDAARINELHKTVIENGVAKMVRQERIPIPPRSKVEFKHHGYHVMLIDLTRPLKEGDQVKVKLRFEKSGTVELTVPVKRSAHKHHHQKEHQHQKQHEHRHQKEEKTAQ